jgi:NHLM bacteriocin system ABC transporter ATP-binding protein
MQDLMDVFMAEGAPQDVAGNHPLLLDDLDSVWLLRSGVLEVFAVPPPREGVPAARVRLFRVEVGQLLFGLGRAPGSVLAVGSPGSQVMRVPRGLFMDLARRPDLVGPLAALLDGWVQGLTAGVARGRPPRRALLLEPGKEARLADNSAVSPGRDALWVRHEQGASKFLGKVEALVAGADGPFPLASPGWLLATKPDTCLSAAATEAVLGDPEAWTGLNRFHQMIITCVALNTAEAEATERERLQRRAESERRLLRTTLSRLADVTRDRGAADLDVGAGAADGGSALDEDPLLAACRLVGAQVGFAARAAHDGSGRGRRSDPVSAIARASRVRVRRVRLAGAWWREDNGPLLAFRTADGRPVALLALSPSRYEVADPQARTRTALTAAEAAAVDPFAYSFYRPFPEGPLTPWGLFRFAVKGGGRDWLAVCLLGLAGSLLGMFTPVVTGWIFDAIIPSADRGQLLLVLLALLVSATGVALFQVTRGIAILRLEGQMDGSVQAAVWDRLLNLPAPFFRRYTAGDLTYRALGIGAMRQVLTDVALSVLLSFVFSLAYFGLLFYYDIRLAGLACAVFLVALAATGLAAWLELRYQRGIYQARGRISGLVLQLITGITRLRLAGAEERALAVWARDFSVQKKLAYRARSVANALAAFNAALPVVSTLVLFAAVARLPTGSLSLGAFLAFSVAFTQVLSSAILMASIVGYAVQVVPLYERAQPILEAVPEVDTAKAPPGDLSGDVELSHVSFRYQADGPLVLDDVTLHIRAGEFVAFVGPSGAGKSTIVRLLLGFETPTGGSIYYDRADLAGLDHQAVRRQIGVVLQDGKLMAGDLFSNIIGSSLLTLEDAWEAARLSGLEQDIREMPMGMQTMLSEGGSTLSGGQRQRLMIARAVVSRPRILLLDEATSALDNRTQAEVSRSLERLKATRIVIAHRLSTIVNADCIYVVDGGRIIQRGRYEELAHQQGLFADLAQRQLV